MPDENAVRALMLTEEVPATRLDVSRLLADGQRSRRRRRRATVAGVALALVAVAVPVAVYATAPRHDARPAAPEFATTTRVVHPTSNAGRPVTCTSRPLPRAEANDYGGIFDVDAAGERIIGASRGGTAVTLWTREQPTLFTIPDGQPSISAVAVNSSGTVLGTDQRPPPSHVWTYRDGRVRRLPVPAGYGHVTPRGLNERGDAVADAQAGSGIDVVVWRGADPDNPRVVAAPDLGSVVDIRNDGVVLAFNEERTVLAVLRPDGTRQDVAVPAELTGSALDMRLLLRGDFLFGTRVVYPTDPTQWTATPAAHPVRWNLRSGTVEIFDLDGLVTAANSSGWFGVRRLVPGGALRVAPDGTHEVLADVEEPAWLSVNGSVLIGVGSRGPTTWRC